MLVQAALVALGATLAAAVPSLTVEGNQFVNPKNGDRFYIAGVAYQPGGSSGYEPSKGVDPLTNKDNCLRDAALMQNLGVNAIRVYNLSPDLNHDECATIFNSAGIYMLIDVNSPLVGESLNSFEPWTSYYAAYLNRTFAIVEAFKSYPNTLAFFAGNEVINDEKGGAVAPPYVRAVTRDLKDYIAKHSSRAIPVGYSAADVRSVLFDTYNYLTCVEDGNQNDTSKADIFALNSYSWCGNSSFTTSGYDTLISGFTGTSVPVFYSEYGCNTPAPRVFTEVPTIYGSQMTGVMSGGIVYEYAQEANNYGLVNISADGSATIMQDFYTLQKQYAALDFTKVQGTTASSKAAVAAACMKSLIQTTGFNNNFTLPVLPPGAADIINNGVSPTPSGKLVTISSWTVSQTVKNSDGSVVTGLAVKVLADDGINQPGMSSTGSITSTGTTSSNSSTTSSSASTTSSSKNAAGRRSMPEVATVLTGAAAAAMIFSAL